MSELFDVVYGRDLVAKLPEIAHRPYLVVTMEDLWPRFAPEFDDAMAHVHFVESLEPSRLESLLGDLPTHECVIGLGGGQATDAAKYLAWRQRLPLFQVPTSMSVNAPFAHRAAVRADGIVSYVGWVVPEAIYVDYDVIAGAPPILNRCGAGDILCYHTAHWDWEFASREGRCEKQWPYDERHVHDARQRLDTVLDSVDEIREVSDRGIEILMEALRWGGAAFANAGWNPRHIEGSEHFFFYALEYLTRMSFIHGQPVCLGILLMSALQKNEPERIRGAIDALGIPYLPSEMGVTWEQTMEAMRLVPEVVERAGLWHTVASGRPITEDFLAESREWIDPSGDRVAA